MEWKNENGMRKGERERARTKDSSLSFDTMLQSDFIINMLYDSIYADKNINE